MRVLVKKIRYVKGIPEELTDKAVAAGELRRGSVVGLDVSFVEFGKDCLIELYIHREGDELLVVPGASLIVEDSGSIYHILEGTVPANESGLAGHAKRPQLSSDDEVSIIETCRTRRTGPVGSCG
ncbi:MAG: hypothetical protein PHG85_00280 [Candidatus Altiarchaeota archaeon]|nr:hypothetical protein [Candidatus Altiarchaeota archaeon]